MKENKVRLLGERDFLPFMKNEGKEWRKSAVKKVRFQSFDGVTLQSYYGIPEGAKGAVVVVHGFAEFFGKYHELCEVLYEAGYAFFFLEQRGHGLSEGKLADPEIVHIDSFRTYVRDLHCFVERVVKRRTTLPLLLLSHSMGGAVAALYLERFRSVFRGAAFCSPMMHLKDDRYTFFHIVAYQLYAWALHKGKTLSPGQKRYNPSPDFLTSSQGSRTRFEYLVSLRKRSPEYHTAGASLQWGIASVIASRVLIRFAGRIETPVGLFEAGDDHLVSLEGQKSFVKRLKTTTPEYYYERARHDLFNAKRPERIMFYRNLLTVLSDFLK